ncbi:MAG: M48 family metalloprotease [Thermodesulfobacteriota bacterium]
MKFILGDREKSLRALMFLLFISVSSFSFPLSCAVNPVTGMQELMLLSEEDEIRLGQETDKEIVKQYGIYEDPKLKTYLDEVCKRLTRVSHRPQLNYQLKIIDASVVNAFAVPGGYLYFSRGILAAINNEAELAGVMGHEIGHIAARHSAQQYTKAQLAQIGFGLGSVLFDSPILTSVVQLGVGMLFFKFSRDNEREADRLGVEYASKAGYDATQLANFFETLNRMNPSSDRSGLPGWFSTHPSPEDRIPLVRSGAKEWQKRLYYREYKVAQESYLKRIDGLVYGEDPRQGYVADQTFYHPILRFQFPVPNQWKVRNKPSQVEILNESGEALLLLTISHATSSREAARSFISKNRPLVIQSEPIELSGFSSYRILSEIRTQKGALRILSYFIEKDKKVFVFHGISSPGQFQNYLRTFKSTFHGFRDLQDPKRIEVAPHRIRIRQVRTSENIENFLLSHGVQKEKLKENILINGLTPDQRVFPHSWLKIIEKS